MWRHHSVHDRKPRHERDADLDQRHARTTRNGEDKWNQQYKSNLEEHWNADDERNEHHRPMQSLLAKQRDQCRCDARRAAGFRHDLAQHRAKSHNDRDEAQYSTDTILKCPDCGGERHASNHSHTE